MKNLLSKFERLLGNIMAGVIILLVVYATVSSLIKLLTGNWKSLNPYGLRGDIYMRDAYGE